MNAKKLTLVVFLVALSSSRCFSLPAEEDQTPPDSKEDGIGSGVSSKEQNDTLNLRQQRQPCDGTWTSWENWSACYTQCGLVGLRNRTRQCTPPPTRPIQCQRQGLAECPGVNSERSYCFGQCGQQVTQSQRFQTSGRTLYPTTNTPYPTTNTPYPTTNTPYPYPRDNCPTVNRRGGWGQWGCWSPCQVGLRVRYRECNDPPPVGMNNYCSGIYDERQSCYNDRTTTIPPKTPVCANEKDVVFAVDSSGSIGASNFNRMSDDLLNVMRQFNLDYFNSGDPRRARVGILTFATSANAVNYLDDFNLPGSLTYSAGGTNTAAAIDMARNQFFQFYRGDRPGNQNVLVVLTDGRSNSGSNTEYAALQAKAAGIRILAWGIGSNVDQLELRNMASNPDTDVYNVGGFNELRNELNNVFRCFKIINL